jgi:hypothetical protein
MATLRLNQCVVIERSLYGGAWRNEQFFLDDPLAVRKIHGKYPEFFRSRIGQHNCYGIGVYDFAYVRCNRAQNLPQIEAGRDCGRQIEEQFKPLLLMLKFPFSAHSRRRSTTHFVTNTFNRMMIHVALKSQAFRVSQVASRSKLSVRRLTGSYPASTAGFVQVGFPILIAHCPSGLLLVCVRFVQVAKLNFDALFSSALPHKEHKPRFPIRAKRNSQ